MVSRLKVRAPPGDRQVPRAPLHAVGVTHRAVTSSVTSEDVTPPSSLIRTHASNQIPLHDSSSPCRRVFAGCRQLLLGDGPSRCYLCNPCLGAWTRTPLRFSGASVRFFPENVGLTPPRRVTTRQNDGRYATLTTQRFRGCSHSLMFRLPRLQRPPGLRPPLRLDIPSVPIWGDSGGQLGPYTPRRTRAVTRHEQWYCYESESDN